MSGAQENYTPEQRRALLRVARRSIENGLESGRPLAVDVAAFDEPLRERRASFVTLTRNGQLRGCIGHLQAIQPLVADVAENAFAAAFQDPRFNPLSAEELPTTHIEISVLGEPQPMTVGSEDELLAALRPGVDGLILEDGPYRATFLPTVWEQLPDPRDFVAALKRKAGMPPNHWSDRMRVSRYHTITFEEEEATV